MPKTRSAAQLAPYSATRLCDWLILGGHFHDPDEGPADHADALPPGQEYSEARLDLDPDKIRAEGEQMLQALIRAGVTDVINCAGEIHNEGAWLEEQKAKAGYFKVPLHNDDNPAGQALPIPPLAFVSVLCFAERERMRRPAARPPVFYVHCFSGHHRGAMVAIWLLMTLGGLSLLEANKLVTRLRPKVQVVEFAAYRQSLLKAYKLVQPLLGQHGPNLPDLLALLKRLQDQMDVKPGDELGKDSGLTHIPDRLPELFTKVKIKTKGGAKGSVTATEELALPDDDEALPPEDTRAALVATGLSKQVKPAEQQLLALALIAWMREVFLHRWGELGMAGATPPQEAVDQIEHEAAAAARSFARTHNREVMQFIARFVQQWSDTHQTHLGVGSALVGALEAWLQARLAQRPAAVAQHMLGQASSLADLFAGGADASYTLAGPEPDQTSCGVCTALYGRQLSSRIAWSNPMPAHLHCEHTWQVVPPSA